ncbi:response regulator [Roseburia intestinalis]|uniref:Circadian input-output histidine kinase CikA n=2 Tax=Roseburia intestinalis L1-82 TaxID=536231 RepID=C7GBP0_9FIRM|nr:response regulator [Roseburia intestinalis]EEV00847.1 ATPase/histidine kinase/DNA gyrase B/HSP90 domain protein [Roseburia intestinalis L1-82]UWP55326.1 ATP-binding protein [Roseburia intestinalis]
MFMIRWKNIKIPQWVIHLLLVLNMGFYVMIATVDYHHLYYKDYWLAPSKANLNGYTLEISPAPMYYVYMAFLLAEIMTTIGIIISSYCSQRSMPNKGKIHFLMIAAMLSPMLLLSLRILKILKGDDPTPLGILLSCIFMSIAVVKYGLFDPVKNAKNYIIDNLKEAVIVTDADHRFLFLNSMADKIITSINKEQGYSTDDKIYAFIQGSQDFFDWKDRHYQVEETVLKDNELIQGYMMTIVDVTKIIEQNHLMKRLVLQTEDANRAKTNFVSNMSHEIRTPMNSIVGITEILLRSRHSPKEQEYLLNIQSSGRVLLTIINDVLDCSKMEAGKMQLFDEPYDTCSLFHDLRISMENRIGHSGLELIYDIDQDIPCKLKGDMGRIRQVIINLVNNAIKYTEKGSVRFSVHVRQKNTDKVMLYYEVADTGIGIRKEDQKILFDAFQRVEMDRNRYVEGTGLGLTISQNLVNMMGGVIEVESEYGKGSRFFFTIEQTIIDPTPVSAVNYNGQKDNVTEKEAECLFIAPEAHILLVDDNELNLVVAKELLKPLRMQIDTAENGLQAVKMVRGSQYDLVLMDHMMPVMDGIEAAKAIRALPEDKYQKLPIIALTANAMVDARKEFLNAGMNGFVAKPIDFARICNQLKLWLPKDLVRDVPKEEAKKLLADDLSDREIQPEDPQMGFSFEEGVNHCGSKAALMKTIRIFYRTIDSKANKIEQCLKEGLISDYVIEVHALKSSALLIGAVPLSEAAKELEDYGKQGKTEVLEEKTPDVLTMYRDLKNILRPYAEKEEDAKKEFSDGEWITALQQIHQCIEQFDLDGVDQIMEQLEEYQVPECIRESMDQLRVYVADVSMEEIMELTDTMTGLLRD